MSEPCSCPNPGFCKRHGVKKGAHWHHLCQTREDYRRAWDEGHGPGQPLPPSPPTERPPPRDCPVIGGACEHGALGRMHLYCRLDLAGVPGGCGTARQIRATAILVNRLAGEAPACPRQSPPG